ncbi:hypothetical protein NL676_034418 [Syzygium grande]|nr:hypothetical protein NL676_034418 [Syzygium grande]
MRLRQGSMTVDQYEAEFTRLSRFALRMVEHPEDKARRFRDGLKPDLRSQMISLNIKDYSEMYERACYRTDRSTGRARSRFARLGTTAALEETDGGNSDFAPPTEEHREVELSKKCIWGLLQMRGSTTK